MEASAVPRPARPVRSPRLLRLASDERLVALVRAGSDEAFEQVYDRHHRGILAFCRHMLGSADEGEDAVQQTFISAYADLRRSEKPIQLRPWLYAIARNRCLSMLRSRREQTALEDVEPATVGLAEEVQRRQDLRDLLADLHRLPHDQRAALVLAELGAVSHEEIAEVLGCPREKVKALVFQARSSLADSRHAREVPCAEIREELSVLRGGALRRTHLRRHLRECVGCRAFRAEVRRQRRTLAVLLPVVPSAGLKSAVLGSVLGGGAVGAAAGGAGLGAGASAGGGFSSLAAKGLASKLAIGAIVAGAGAGGVATVSTLERHHHHATPAAAPRTPPSHAVKPAATAPAAAPLPSQPGATPVRPERAVPATHGKSAHGHAIALSHGKGLKRGLRGTQPGQTKTTAPKHHAAAGNGQARGHAKTQSTGRGHAQHTGTGSRPPKARTHVQAKGPKPERQTKTDQSSTPQSVRGPSAQSKGGASVGGLVPPGLVTERARKAK